MKKRKIIVAVVLIPIIVVAGFFLYSRESAKKDIYAYMAKQGIKEEQLQYTQLSIDFTRGGYWLATYVEGENPNIFYMYLYRDKKILFQAYSDKEANIKNKQWGGNGLSKEEKKKLKYPPVEQ